MEAFEKQSVVRQNAKEKTKLILAEQMFKGSQILVGIQAFLLYFNLPEIIIKNMLLPKRLFPNPKINNANEPENFPNTMNTVEWFES